MNQGYTFPKLPCPYCDRLIGANWLVRHLKQAHDGEQCNVEESTPEVFIDIPTGAYSVVPRCDVCGCHHWDLQGHYEEY